MKETIIIQPASEEDVKFLVQMVAEASAGLWPGIWQGFARDGETVNDVAVRFLSDARNDLSFRNATVAMSAGTRLGAMIAYAHSDAPPNAEWPAPPQDLIDALEPFRELGDLESLYISELCCVPAVRGQGVGTRFLDRAKAQAREQGLPRVTLQVLSENEAAIRLYLRYGFTKVDERAIIPHPAISPRGKVFLMSLDV